MTVLCMLLAVRRSVSIEPIQLQRTCWITICSRPPRAGIQYLNMSGRSTRLVNRRWDRLADQRTYACSALHNPLCDPCTVWFTSKDRRWYRHCSRCTAQQLSCTNPWAPPSVSSPVPQRRTCPLPAPHASPPAAEPNIPLCLRSHCLSLFVNPTCVSVCEPSS